MKEISIKDIENIKIGQTENAEAGTGCTVFLCEKGMRAGLDVRGGGPSSRESGLLDPITLEQMIHAVVLGGGSSFGLDASGGVMQYLEEHGIGYDVGVVRVPLVVQSDIFDLAVGRSDVRPDRAMGYEAAKLAAETPNYRDGNFGVGCGATVGKLYGPDFCMKTGIGSYALQIGELKLGAVAVVNSYGDIFTPDGKKIAGLLTEDKKRLRSTVELMAESIEVVENKFVGNTTLCAVITNAAFCKTQLCKIAGMAHDGMARSIDPVHTSADGDSIYALSVGGVSADMDLVGVLAAKAVSHAIARAVTSAESAYGLPASKDLDI